MAQLNDLLVTGNSRFLNEINGQIDWSNVLSKPTIPAAANNGTLTIQKNGTNVQTFTANQSTNATANITVPTKVSELTNDSGYTTNTGTVTQVKVGSTAYNPTSGVISLPAYPTDTDTKVTQTETTTNAEYEVLFSETTSGGSTSTEGARKNSKFIYNPSTARLTVASSTSAAHLDYGKFTLENSSANSIKLDLATATLGLTVGHSGVGITYGNTDVVTSNGNTWDGTNTSLKDAIANIIDLLHPVGSIYMSLTDSTVAEVEAKFGGTWEKIEDRFLLAASSSYAVDSTGGSADAVVVSHTHELAGTNAKAVDVAAHTHPLAGTNAKAKAVDGHTHTEYAGINEATSGLFTSITGTRSYPNTHIIGGPGTTSKAGGHSHTLEGNTSTGGAHGHSLQGNTKSSGESGTGKNMPPYLAVYMYKRTA